MSDLKALEEQLGSLKEKLSKSHNIDECALLGDQITDIKQKIYFLKANNITHEKEVVSSKDVPIVADAKNTRSTVTRGQVRLNDGSVSIF